MHIYARQAPEAFSSAIARHHVATDLGFGIERREEGFDNYTTRFGELSPMNGQNGLLASESFQAAPLSPRPHSTASKPPKAATAVRFVARNAHWRYVILLLF
jgi:hypothetical protein